MTIPIIQPFLRSFGSPEFLMFAVVGIAFVSSLTGPSPVKGLTNPAASPTNMIPSPIACDLLKSTRSGKPLTGPSMTASLSISLMGGCLRKFSSIRWAVGGIWRVWR